MQAVPLLWMEVASYKHYFVIVEVGEKNIRARCKLCAGNKTLSCARNTTFNFKKHLDNGTRLAAIIISLLFCTNLDDHLEK